MAKITVAEQDVEFVGKVVPAYARVIYSNTFTNSDDETVIGGSLTGVYTKQVAVTYANNVATIAPFSGANQIDSTIYGISGGNLATLTLALYSSKGQYLATVYDNIRVPDTPNPTTWADLDTYSNARVEPFRHAYYDVDAINRLIGGAGIASKMSTVVYGTGVLDTIAASVSAPTVVGANSPRITKSLVSDYGGSLASLEAETADVLVTIKTNVTTTTARTFPANVMLDIQKGGKITASNCAVSIASLRDPGNRQVFAKVGTGTVTLARGAVEEINLAWFADPTADATWGITQCINSMNAAAGGKTITGGREWLTTGNIPFPSHGTIEGVGSSPDANPPSSFKLTANNASIFTLATGYRNGVLRDIVLDCGTTTGSKCFYATPDAGSAGFAFTFERVTFQGGEYGDYWHTTNGGEVEQVKFTDCQWVAQTINAHYCDSVNGSWHFDQCMFFMSGGIDACNLNYSGKTLFTNSTCQGVGGAWLKCTNANAGITMIACQDEGMTNWATIGTSDYRYPYVWTGCVIQSQIQINASCVITSTGNHYRFSDTYQSAVGAGGRVNSYGDSIDAVTDQNGTPVVPKKLANFTGTGSIITTENITTDNQTTNRMPTRFLSPAQLDGNASTPVVSFGNYTATSTEKILARFGRTTIDGTFDYYFDITRKNTGKFHVDANQTGFCNFVWGSDIEVPDEAYDATNWNGNLEVPTKNAVRDKVVAMDASTATNTSNIATNTTNIATNTADILLKAPITNAALVTPNIGVASGTSLTATGLIKSSGTAGIGYTAGASGTASGTWAGGATLNKTTGQITLDSKTFAANTSYSVAIANSTYATGDSVIVGIESGAADPSTYGVSWAHISNGNFRICVRSYATPTETLVFQVTVIKGS